MSKQSESETAKPDYPFPTSIIIAFGVIIVMIFVLLVVLQSLGLSSEVHCTLPQEYPGAPCAP